MIDSNVTKSQLIESQLVESQLKIKMTESLPKVSSIKDSGMKLLAFDL